MLGRPDRKRFWRGNCSNWGLQHLGDLSIAGLVDAPLPLDSYMTVDQDRLRKAAVHVAHDIQMLRDAWLQLDNAFAYTAWFIHCRSVMDFLDGIENRPDDIHAKAYFDDPTQWQAADAATSKPLTYGAYRIAVNKLAAHLTFARIDYAENMDFRPSKTIHDYLLGRCAVFVKALPIERVSWFAGLGL